MFITDQILSDASRYSSSRSLKQLDSNLPFVSVLGAKYDYFFGHQNSCYPFVMLSRKYGQQNCICENTSRCGKLNLYFDFDSKSSKLSDSQIQDVILSLKNKISTLLPGITSKIFVKDASNADLTSLHLVCHLSTSDGSSLYIRNKDEMKSLFKLLALEPPFDIAVYSGYNLRLLYSNKFDQKSNQWTNRRFKPSKFSDYENDIYSLTTYCSNEKFIMLSDYVKKQFVLDFVKNNGFSKEYTLDQVQQRDQDEHWSLLLTEQKCTERDHNSNNSVAMLHSDNIIIKCLDEECQSCFYQKLHISDFQIYEVQGGTYTQSDHGGDNIEVNTNIQSQDEYTKVQNACNEAIKSVYQCGYLTNFFNNVGPKTFSLSASPGKAPNLEHALDVKPLTFTGENNHISFQQNGRQYSYQYPPELQESLSSIDKTYTKNDLKKLQVITNNIVFNYVTINNNGKSKKEEETPDVADFLPIIDEKEKYFVNKLFNRRMHFITDFYNYLKPNQFIYKPADDTRKTIFYFTNINNDKETDGGQWSNVDGPKELIKRIRNTFEDYFDDKKKQIDKKHQKAFNVLFNYVLNTIEKQSQMQQYAMETFKTSCIEFNQNIHLIHFQNGTYDLEERQFIKTTPEMYNTQQIRYDYNKNAKYDFIEPVVKQIIGDDEYEWFIQQLAYCLMPDRTLEKKQIVILTGQGNNGKTLIFNLMNNTIDTLAYGVNGRSLMIQASNEQLSNATPDLMTLKDMRFCYFAELDANKPFNQQQIKMLTGAEKVKGRNLYGGLDEFEAHAGIFVSCNQIPRIQTSDGGFVDRLKVILLQKQFVEKPEENNQFQLKKDKRLLNYIKSMKWRQGFMKMLLDYHYKDDIPIPNSVQQYIEQRVNLSKDQLVIWAEEKIIFEQDGILTPDEILEQFNDEKETKYKIGIESFKMRFDQFLKLNPEKFSNVKYIRKQIPKSHYAHYNIDFNKKDVKKFVYTNVNMMDYERIIHNI